MGMKMQEKKKEKEDLPPLFTLVPKRIKGKPDDAIGYFEGGIMSNPKKFPLTDELKAKGMAIVGFKSWFKDAIKKANKDYFEKIGCLAVYAEYGWGQQAMVVFEDKEKVIEDGRVKEYKKSKPDCGVAAGGLAGAGVMISTQEVVETDQTPMH